PASAGGLRPARGRLAGEDVRREIAKADGAAEERAGGGSQDRERLHPGGAGGPEAGAAARERQRRNAGIPAAVIPSPAKAWTGSARQVEITTAAQMAMKISVVTGWPGIENGARVPRRRKTKMQPAVRAKKTKSVETM